MRELTSDPAPGADIAFVDPQLRGPLEELFKEPIEVNQENLQSLRDMPLAGKREPAASPSWELRLIAGPRGSPDVPVYVVNAQSVGSAKPAILHIHGGGYVMGSAATSVPALQPIAGQLDCVVISVEYRLAPETRFPGSLEDNYAALKWLHDNAASLGVDAGRIAVMGESAGGGHAVMLAIAARDRDEIPLVAQVLLYPMLDDRTGTSRNAPAPIGRYVWTPASNRFGWSSLLGKPAGSEPIPDGAVPARVSDLKGLPPAFIGLGSLDLFVNEDIEYASRLLQAGVATELVVLPGAYHAFDMLCPDAPLSRQLHAARLEMLRRHLCPPTVRTAA